MASKVASCLFPVRDRKNEMSEALFSCPFPRKNGNHCMVSQKYRSMKIHCKNMHGGDISLRCNLGNCRWKCNVSLRCLTSHRDNPENHGILTLNGCEDLDGTCIIVPFEGDEHTTVGEHTAACAVAKYELKKYSGKMLKRAERAKQQAIISGEHKETALEKVIEQNHPVPAKEITLKENTAPVSAVVIAL